MSIKYISWVFEHSESENAARLVAIALADHADDWGRCWPGYERIAKKTRLSVRSIGRAIVELVKLGEVSVIREHYKGKQTKVYQMLTPDKMATGQIVRSIDGAPAKLSETPARLSGRTVKNRQQDEPSKTLPQAAPSADGIIVEHRVITCQEAIDELRSQVTTPTAETWREGAKVIKQIAKERAMTRHQQIIEAFDAGHRAKHDGEPYPVAWARDVKALKRLDKMDLPTVLHRARSYCDVMPDDCYHKRTIPAFVDAYNSADMRRAVPPEKKLDTGKPLVAYFETHGELKRWLAEGNVLPTGCTVDIGRDDIDRGDDDTDDI